MTPDSEDTILALPPLPEPLGDQDLDELCLFLPLIQSWMKAVEKEVELRIGKGVTFSNAHLVPKRANRSWVDEEKTKEYLNRYMQIDDYQPRKLISPSQAEKVLSKVRHPEIAQITQKISSGTTLVLGASQDDSTED